jgi:hypothetical protein
LIVYVPVVPLPVVAVTVAVPFFSAFSVVVPTPVTVATVGSELFQEHEAQVHEYPRSSVSIADNVRLAPTEIVSVFG